MSYHGHVENGVIILDEPNDLPEGSKVEVNPVEQEEALQSLREGLLKFAGTVDDLPPDMSLNHDHYLYGTPRR